MTPFATTTPRTKFPPRVAPYSWPLTGRWTEALPRAARPSREAQIPKPAPISVVCLICLRPIEPSLAINRNWKSCHQPLELNNASGDFVPAQKYSWVHSCCWEVARNVLGSSIFDQTWLKAFANHLFLLKPFANRTPFDCETHYVDPEVLAEVQFISNSDKGTENLQRILPPPFFPDAFQLLNQKPDVIRMDDVKKVDRCLAYSLSKVIPYSLSINKDMDVRPNLQKVVQNLGSSDASRFPRIYNLRVAWDNVQNAVDAMENTPAPSLLGWDSPIPGSANVLKYCIPTERCHRLTFSFSPYLSFKSRGMKLSGFAYDGKWVGHLVNPNHNSHFDVLAFKGLHLARDYFGNITAIRVKDGERWSSWSGVPACARDDLELEWDSCEKDLIFHFDVSVLLVYQSKVIN